MGSLAALRSSALRALVAVPLVVLAACHHRDTGEEVVVTSSTCLRCAPATKIGSLTSEEMDETSGLVASTTREGVYFAHNDSGDRARFFAVDERGARLATYVYSSDRVRDCEDLGIGPCGDGTRGSCLFIGDIGDNLRLRDEISVYRVHEPDTFTDATVSSDRLRFVYPDGAHNAEALLVHPTTGVLTIVVKEDKRPSGIYEAPLPFTPGARATLRRVGSIASPAGSKRFTGASVRAGEGILLRTYTHAYFVRLDPATSVAEALAAPLCSLPVRREETGEAIAWRRDGGGFLTIGEGEGADVNFTACTDPR
ncbi:MAG TPA: hypothetical protein VGI39_36925 [Polyangiaceae bacterium]